MKLEILQLKHKIERGEWVLNDIWFDVECEEVKKKVKKSLCK